MGEFFSILCTIFWAISVVLIKFAGKNISSKHINAYKTTVVSFLFLLTIIINGDIRLFSSAKNIDLLLLIISSFFGMTIGDTLYYKSLKLVSASVIAIIAASQPPIMILLSSIFYDEKLFFKDYIGAGLVCLAIILSASKNNKNVKISFDLIKGIFIGLFAVIIMAASILIIKKPGIVSYSILESYSPIWTSSIRVFVSSLFLSPICLLAKDRLNYINLYKISNPLSKFMLPAAITGGYLALLFWVLGITYVEKISIAVILNQLSIVFITLLAAVFLKEKLTLKKIISMSLAITGCIIVLI